MPSNLDGDDESRKFLVEMKIVAAIGCLLIFLYSLCFWASGQLLRILGVGMLVAGAALLSGFLLGFVFAIPRVGDKKWGTATVEPEDTQTPDSGAQHGSVLRNGNLVEISDWLTKIILGVGLVELHSIPGELGRISSDLAPGLQPSPCAEPLIGGQAAGLAILIFYFTLGFLLGYVWTGIFFQGDLERKLKDAEQQTEAERRQKRIANRIQWIETCINEKQFDRALTSIDEALKNDPQNALFVMTKARILKREASQPGQSDRDKLLKEALAFADRAIALLPDKGEPIYNKACYQALLDPAGLKSSVLENLKAAFRLNPGLRQNAKDDEDLASLKQDADFVKLIG
ncbi:MAG: hypothetical protein ABR991_12045, partial [Terracidiphilus sp.]